MRKLMHCGLIAALALGVGLAGCSKKADTNKPIEQIQKEVEGMNLSQLESNARVYANEIQGKQGEVAKVLEQVKSIPPTELLGEKAKKLRDDASAIKNEISALTQRYNIYANKFKEMGGDVSKIKI